MSRNRNKSEATAVEETPISAPEADGQEAAETNGKASAQPPMTQDRKKRKKAARNPTLCYILCECNREGNPFRIAGSRPTGGQAAKLLDILLQSAPPGQGPMRVFRAVEV
jgi:hypothetical protein